ncbi:MAG: hypothetical protein V3T58_01220 [Candidatus Hydrothermarchaeales archaeon]
MVNLIIRRILLRINLVSSSIARPTLAGILSYFIARHYYAKGSRDLNPIKEDLERLRLELLGDTELGTSKHRNKKNIGLYHNKVYDTEGIKAGNMFGWRVCPRCGSDNLEGSSYTDYTEDETYFMIRCKGCGNSEFNRTCYKKVLN